MEQTQLERPKQINTFCFLGLTLGILSAILVLHSVIMIVIILAVVTSIIGLITYKPEIHTKNSFTYAIIGLVLSIIYLSVSLHLWRYINVPFY